MPPVTIYAIREDINSVRQVLPELTQIIAKELSCSERKLADTDIHISVLVPELSHNVAGIRIDIQAYGYPERIKRQDDICHNIQQYMLSRCLVAGPVEVFLMLGELGYSFNRG